MFGSYGSRKRRYEDAGAVRAHLVHVVGDLRLVLAVDIDGEPRLLLGEHEPVAVVVVSGVAVVQVRVDARISGAARVVPVVDHQDLAVRILGRDEQQHRVVEGFPDLGGVLRRQPVDYLDDCLPVAYLVRVDGGVQEIEGHPFPRERGGVRLRQAPRVRQTVVDRDQPVELVEVRRGADGEQYIRVAVRRRAPLLIPDTVGTAGHLAHVLQHVRIARQFTVGPNLEAEEVGWRADGLRAGRARPEHEGGDHGRKQAECHRILLQNTPRGCNDGT